MLYYIDLISTYQVYNVKRKCITLLDDGSGRDPMEVHDFGPAAQYLFRPCELDDDFFDMVRNKIWYWIICSTMYLTKAFLWLFLFSKMERQASTGQKTKEPKVVVASWTKYWETSKNVDVVAGRIVEKMHVSFIGFNVKCWT